MGSWRLLRVACSNARKDGQTVLLLTLADLRLGLAVQDAMDWARMKTALFQALSGQLDLPLVGEAALLRGLRMRTPGLSRTPMTGQSHSRLLSRIIINEGFSRQRPGR